MFFGQFRQRFIRRAYPRHHAQHRLLDALGHEYLSQHASRRGLAFDLGLVRLHGEEHVAHGNGVVFLLQPLCDRGFLDGLAQLGEFYFLHGFASILSGGMR
jgi:hypothetical protein